MAIQAVRAQTAETTNINKLLAIMGVKTDEAVGRATDRAHETSDPESGGKENEGSSISPIADAQSDMEKTFLIAGSLTVAAA